MKRTDIICIIDKSGSMGALANDAIGGFNTFLREQQELPGEAALTVVLFDTTDKVLYDRVPIKTADPLTTATYKPGGGTALLDAIGNALAIAEPRFAAPVEQALVVIITDGEENSSREHKRDTIKATIDRLSATGKWTFMYLGANVDAFAEAGQLGIAANMTANYSASGVGTQSVYAGVTSNATSLRSTGKVDAQWKKKVV